LGLILRANNHDFSNELTRLRKSVRAGAWRCSLR
jgi:hypothetical protein